MSKSLYFKRAYKLHFDDREKVQYCTGPFTFLSHLDYFCEDVKNEIETYTVGMVCTKEIHTTDPK